ncbi:hypothetical protein F5X99DRAFT_431517 [Biscogniauxia marginata]|nr:hypothetical protein F5X99DRAFT_431517 [Biscogniauxia marginata]
MSNTAIYPAGLLVLSLWDAFEKRLSGVNAKHRLYNASDVSLVVPTVDWDENLVPNLCGWLSNNPGEVIIITVVSEAAKARALIETESCCSHAPSSPVPIRIYRSNWRTNNLVHPGRAKGPEIITPWEVAALRIRQKRGRSMKAAFAADGGINFCVSGVTMLLRAEILKDPEFQHAFTHDFWLGKRQNMGDDGFITRWVLFHHVLSHHIDGQAIPKQWYRSSLRLRLTCLFLDPGVRVLAIVRLVFWLLTIYHFPLFALAFAGWDLYLWTKDLIGFSKEYPYCGWRLWAAIIIDKLYLISDWYCWLTLSHERWMTRAFVDDEVGREPSLIKED